MRYIHFEWKEEIQYVMSFREEEDKEEIENVVSYVEQLLDPIIYIAVTSPEAATVTLEIEPWDIREKLKPWLKTGNPE